MSKLSLVLVVVAVAIGQGYTATITTTGAASASQQQPAVAVGGVAVDKELLHAAYKAYSDHFTQATSSPMPSTVSAIVGNPAGKHRTRRAVRPSDCGPLLDNVLGLLCRAKGQTAAKVQQQSQSKVVNQTQSASAAAQPTRSNQLSSLRGVIGSYDQMMALVHAERLKRHPQPSVAREEPVANSASAKATATATKDSNDTSNTNSTDDRHYQLLNECCQAVCTVDTLAEYCK